MRLLQAEVEENVSIEALVDGASCSVPDLYDKARGEMGNLLIEAFDATGKARVALGEAIARICG